jgi:hypothetical protein
MTITTTTNSSIARRDLELAHPFYGGHFLCVKGMVGAAIRANSMFILSQHWHVGQPGCIKQSADAGAVPLIQRFGSALNLRVQLY